MDSHADTGIGNSQRSLFQGAKMGRASRCVRLCGGRLNALAHSGGTGSRLEIVTQLGEIKRSWDLPSELKPQEVQIVAQIDGVAKKAVL